MLSSPTFPSRHRGHQQGLSRFLCCGRERAQAARSLVRVSGGGSGWRSGSGLGRQSRRGRREQPVHNHPRPSLRTRRCEHQGAPIMAHDNRVSRLVCRVLGACLSGSPVAWVPVVWGACALGCLLFGVHAFRAPRLRGAGRLVLIFRVNSPCLVVFWDVPTVFETRFDNVWATRRCGRDPLKPTPDDAPFTRTVPRHSRGRRAASHRVRPLRCTHGHLVAMLACTAT